MSAKSLDEQGDVLEVFHQNSSRLYVIFGGIAQGFVLPPFEFIKTLEPLGHSCLFLRDAHQMWYHLGVRGQTNSITHTVEYLKNIIKRSHAQEVIFTGNSMGGYAALLLGSLVGNVRIIAFSPQTFIGLEKTLKHGDLRWFRRMATLSLRKRSSSKYFDLKNHFQSLKTHPQSTLYVSRKERRDLAHAQNMQGLPNMTIIESEHGGHKLVKQLRDSGELLKILTAA